MLTQDKILMKMHRAHFPNETIATKLPRLRLASKIRAPTLRALFTHSERLS